MAKYDDYLKAKKDYDDAVEWNNLPNGQKYQNDKMDVSVGHCSLKLVRAGQQYQGGQNYWESPGALNSMILSVILDRGGFIDFAIARLSERATKALADCEQETVDRLADIQKAKDSIK